MENHATEIESLCASMATQRGEISQLSDSKKKLEKQLEENESKLLALFEQDDRTSYLSKNGLFYVSHKTSVKVPSTPDARERFFAFLKERGIFENMITVHSQTLNSFYKQEFEAAKEKGEVSDFEIPGLDAPTISQTVSFKAQK